MSSDKQGEAPSALWLTWEIQRRNRSMARLVEAELHEPHVHRRGFRRYLSLALFTYLLVRSRKPSVVFFQNPSLLLGLLLVSMRRLRLFRGTLVADYHNAGVRPPLGKAGLALTRWIARGADLVIVTNDQLKLEMDSWNVRSAVVPDPLPSLPVRNRAIQAQSDKFELLFISSWAADEPISEVVLAAQLLYQNNANVNISITGRPRLPERLGLTQLPPNVRLTGFLSESDFGEALASCDAVMDLTTRPDCMVCGAYEAVAAGKPGLLSNNAATTQYFARGFLFTDNSPADIHTQILELRSRLLPLTKEVEQLREVLLLNDLRHVQQLRISIPR